MEAVNLSLNDFNEDGLYLIFPDSSRVVLSKEKIEQFASQFLEDPAKVPASCKKAVDFQNCVICPKRGTGEFCDALRPTLPFLEMIDRYVSFDKVTVVFKEKNSGLLHVRNTDMQKALQFLSMLSLIHYCEVGHSYAKYFLGVMPLMEIEEVAERIYLNIYWHCRGDVPKMKEIIGKFSQEIRHTSQCQIRRLGTICKNDAFINAFVLTQLVADLVSMMNDDDLTKSFNDFEKKYSHP